MHVTELPREKHEKALAWTLFTGAALRVLFYFLSDDNGGDALGRAASAAAWMQHPTLHPPLTQWGPGHFYLAGPVGWLVGDAELATRFLSLAAGIGVLWIIYHIGRILGDEESARLSTLIVAFSGLAIGYSTTSSSESLYLFFLLAGIWGWLEYLRNERTTALVAGALSLAVSSGIRYETWIFLPVLSLFLLNSPRDLFRADFWSSRRLRAILLFCLLAGSWAYLWSAYSWFQYGDPLYAIHFNAEFLREAAAQQSSAGRAAPSLYYELALPAAVILLGLSPLPFMGAICAVAGLARHPPARRYIGVTMFFLGVYYLQIFRHATVSTARYTLTAVLLFAVLGGLGLTVYRKRLSANRSRAFSALVLTSMILTQAGILLVSESRTRISERMASVSPRLRYAHYIDDVSDQLRNRFGPSDSIVIDEYNFEGNIVAHALGLPLLATERALLVYPEVAKEIPAYLERRHPRYMIYSDLGMIQRTMRMPDGCSAGELQPGIFFRCLYANKVYRIYELTYP
jgi:4-amino-4-deoxy-L-arabinose transferase-like glycosyltransferase